MTTTVPLKIAFVRHAAGFTVDEEGTALPQRRWSVRPSRDGDAALRVNNRHAAADWLKQPLSSFQGIG